MAKANRFYVVAVGINSKMLAHKRISLCANRSRNKSGAEEARATWQLARTTERLMVVRADNGKAALQRVLKKVRLLARLARNSS
jgi:hypothetical protein